MSDTIKIGIAGLGTVGAGLIKIIQKNSKILAARSGKSIKIIAVSALSKSKDRGVDLSAYEWENDPVNLAKRDDIDVFVELIGGEDGHAKQATEAAIKHGKHVVTANKAMLAMYGQELAISAESNNVNLRFEAAVAGGIPVIKALTESLAGNNITRIMGVMNGTCNYILTRMEDTGLPYEEIFEEANQLGFLEADPNLDVGGIDAAHKLVLLSSIAYGTQVDFEGAVLEGIGRISIEDIRAASEMGYRIKLLGVSTMNGLGLSQTMRPCLVPASSPLAQLDGGTNMIIIEGDSVGQIVLRGAGAGAGPTASAVIADILDIARGFNIPVFGQPAKTLKKVSPINTTAENSFYIRLNLKDVAGILAKVSAALANAGISIDRIRQEGHETDAAPVIIVTHPTERDLLNKAIAEIEATSAAIDPPVVLRIETV